ncbi:LexA family transcriptional regulator [Clostridium carnis]
MEFSKVQNKFIYQKSQGIQLLKGKKGTGKSTSSIYRAINLENNYCIYENDEVLILTGDYNKTNEAIKLYKSKSNKDYFYSLFSLDKERVKISTLEDIINTYSNAYRREGGIVLKYVNKEKIFEILTNLDEVLSNFSKKSKFLKSASRDLIIDEIMWIKASNFTKQEYLDVDRKGRNSRIRKNSYTREALYSLKELYNKELLTNNLMDEYDHVLFSIKYITKHNIYYSHIIVDDCENLTKGEIDFVKNLYSMRSYSSLVFIVNSELDNKKYSWLVKGRKFKTLGTEFKGKTFNFKTKFEKELVKPQTIENYTYVNLKNKKIYNFNIDISSPEYEILLEDKVSFKEDELKEVPVFTNIAAGNPIEINDSIEGNFKIPMQWLERGKETFILTVRGDSMVDKNICDGDLVVIKKQQTANHNDIVAANLDGQATLKTLNMNSNIPMLMPANTMYNPISLEDKEVSILGIAIGVIKQN